MLTSLELLTICIIVMVFYFFRQQTAPFSLSRINGFIWVFGMDLLLMSAASIFYLDTSGLYTHWMYRRLPKGNEAFFYAWAAIMWTLITLPLGFWFSNRLFSIRKPLAFFTDYLDGPLEGFHSHRDKWPLYFLSSIAFAACVYSVYHAGGIPLLQWFSGEYKQMAVRRIEFVREFAGIVYIKNILFLTLTPFLSYVAAADWLSRRTWSSFWLFLGLLGISLIAVTFGLSKYVLVIYFLGFAYLYVLVKGRIPGKVLGAIGVFALVLLLGTYYLIMEGDPDKVARIWGTILARITQTQAAGIYLSFYYFPDFHDFTGISSISKHVSLLGMEPSDRPSRLLLLFASPEEEAARTAGYASALFVSEAWGGFGLLGVLLSPIYVGFFVKSLFNAAMKAGKSPFLVGFLVFVSLNLYLAVGFNHFFKPVLIGCIGVIVIFAELARPKKQNDKLKSGASPHEQ